MRSFSRQLRDAAHRSFTALVPRWSWDMYAMDTASTSTHTFFTNEKPTHLVEVDLNFRAHKHSSHSSSAASSSSSLAVDDVHAVRFAHMPIGRSTSGTDSVPVCRRILDPPPSLENLMDDTDTRQAIDPTTGFHPLAPPPCHYRRRKHSGRVVDLDDDASVVDALQSHPGCLGDLEPMRFPF
ncbi:hypothetical protein PENSPDRAFT_733820 [Peniophora sp. CONT]|nr:hypothetical protein PENSPDRAFT_733820 [Peniophora sp. CONT]